MKHYSLLLLLFSYSLMAQTPLCYNDYLQRVTQNNLAYAAERLNISIAEANAEAARIFNDPTLEIEYGYNDEVRLQMGQGIAVALSQTISFGKRQARIDLSNSEQELANALLKDYLRQLRLHASEVYLAAVQEEALYMIAEHSYRHMHELASNDSVRLKSGEISESTAVQSRIEAQIAYNELIAASVNRQNASTELATLFGVFSTDTQYIPNYNLEADTPNFVLADLLDNALSNRADLHAALQQTQVAKKAALLAKKERNTDIDIALGYNYNTEVRNELAPAPAFHGFSIGLAVPLQFSNTNKGALRAASYQTEQAELLYKQAQIDVQKEVMQAYNAYLAAAEQVNNFDQDILNRAHNVLKETMDTYSKGDVHFVEVQQARRTYKEAQTLYVEALTARAEALLQLEAAVGM